MKRSLVEVTETAQDDRRLQIETAEVRERLSLCQLFASRADVALSRVARIGRSDRRRSGSTGGGGGGGSYSPKSRSQVDAVGTSSVAVLHSHSPPNKLRLEQQQQLQLLQSRRAVKQQQQQQHLQTLEEQRMVRLKNLHISVSKERSLKDQQDSSFFGKRRVDAVSQDIAKVVDHVRQTLITKLLQLTATNNDPKIVQKGYHHLNKQTTTTTTTSNRGYDNSIEVTTTLNHSPTHNNNINDVTPYHQQQQHRASPKALSPFHSPPAAGGRLLPPITAATTSPATQLKTMMGNEDDDGDDNNGMHAAVVEQTCKWIETVARDGADAQRLADQSFFELRREMNLKAKRQQMAAEFARRHEDQLQQTRRELARAVDIAHQQTIGSVRAKATESKALQDIPEDVWRMRRLPECMSSMTRIYSVQDLEKRIAKSLECSLKEQQQRRRGELTASLATFQANVEMAQRELAACVTQAKVWLDTVRQCIPSQHHDLQLAPSLLGTRLNKLKTTMTKDAQQKLLLNNLLQLQQKSKAPMLFCLVSCLKANATAVNLPAAGEGVETTLTSEDMCLLNDFLCAMPSVSSLNLCGGVKMNAIPTWMLVALSVERESVTRVDVDDTTKLWALLSDQSDAASSPEAAVVHANPLQMVQDLARRHRESALHRRGLHIAKEKVRGLQEVESAEWMFMPFVRRRAMQSVTMLVEHLLLSEKCIRDFVKVAQVHQREAVVLEHRLALERLTSMSSKLDAQREGQHAVFSEESIERQAIESLCERSAALLLKESLLMKQSFRRLSRRLSLGMMLSGGGASFAKKKSSISSAAFRLGHQQTPASSSDLLLHDGGDSAVSMVRVTTEASMSADPPLQPQTGEASSSPRGGNRTADAGAGGSHEQTVGTATVSRDVSPTDGNNDYLQQDEEDDVDDVTPPSGSTQATPTTTATTKRGVVDDDNNTASSEAVFPVVPTTTETECAAAAAAAAAAAPIAAVDAGEEVPFTALKTTELASTDVRPIHSSSAALRTKSTTFQSPPPSRQKA